MRRGVCFILARMTWKSVGLVAVAVMVMTTFAPRVAHACSPPGRGCFETVNVFAEIENRPTNACVWITSEIRDWELPSDTGTDADADGGVGMGDFVYVAPDGEEIALLPGVMRCPERELAPLTEYAVVGPTDCGRGERREYGRFTTGTGPDTTAPSAPGASSQSCTSDRCDDSACCGPYTASIVTTYWGASTDDSGLVLYDAGRGLQSLTYVSYFSTSSGSVMFDRIFSFGTLGIAYAGVFRGVRAYDIAGHESPLGPSPTTCPPPPPPPDAAIDPALDAFMPDVGSISDSGASLDAETTSPPPSGCGCRAHRGHTSATLSISGLVLVGVIARRRRRRP